MKALLLLVACFFVLHRTEQTEHTSDDELQELKFLEEIFDEVQHQSKVKKNKARLLQFLTEVTKEVMNYKLIFSQQTKICCKVQKVNLLQNHSN